MNLYSIAVGIISLVVEGAILVRAIQQGLLSKFPFFVSYIAYVFSSSLLELFVYRFAPDYYPKFFWFLFLIRLVAEFAVLVEISDHLFESFGAIQRLGRLIVLSLTAA